MSGAPGDAGDAEPKVLPGGEQDDPPARYADLGVWRAPENRSGGSLRHLAVCAVRLTLKSMPRSREERRSESSR
jgi:hypothetical protein